MPSAKPRGCWRLIALKRAISLIRIEILAVEESLKANSRPEAPASIGCLTQGQHGGIVLMSKLAIN